MDHLSLVKMGLQGAKDICVGEGVRGLQSDGQYAHYQHLLSMCLVSSSNLPALGPNSPTGVKNESIIRRRWAPDDCGPVTTEAGNDCHDEGGRRDHPHHPRDRKIILQRHPASWGSQHGTKLMYARHWPWCRWHQAELWILGTGAPGSDLGYRESVSSLCNNHHQAEELTQRGGESRNWFSAGVTFLQQKTWPHKLSEDNTWWTAVNTRTGGLLCLQNVSYFIIRLVDDKRRRTDSASLILIPSSWCQHPLAPLLLFLHKLYIFCF